MKQTPTWYEARAGNSFKKFADSVLYSGMRQPFLHCKNTGYFNHIFRLSQLYQCDQRIQPNMQVFFES